MADWAFIQAIEFWHVIAAVFLAFLLAYVNNWPLYQKNIRGMMLLDSWGKGKFLLPNLTPAVEIQEKHDALVAVSFITARAAKIFVVLLVIYLAASYFRFGV
ncbi:MAG: hypothetical protein GY742_15670 [Hyphomicrobiales bacterium]|nr:hypothetical protein [Hyphomicrobiales bacterium]